MLPRRLWFAAVLTLHFVGSFCLVSDVEIPPTDPPSECPGPNEVYSTCGSDCLTCANRKTGVQCPDVCLVGCFCKTSFLRNADGVCVPPGQCDKPTCTGKHEVYSACGNNLCQVTCDTFGKIIPCNPICKSGCICDRGFARNKKGTCVHPTECENAICTEPNQEFTECVSPCRETCVTRGQNIICNFLVCNQGCDCKTNYFRNSHGVCVPPEQCDNCQSNAVYSECNNHPCIDTCSVPNRSSACSYSEGCYPGCICNEGYLMNDIGVCVPREECVCKENEVMDMCFNPCPPDTCDSAWKQIKCPGIDPKDCKIGCKCKPNYKRDSRGVCIPIEQCPNICGTNEVYNNCAGYCTFDDTCSMFMDGVVPDCAPPPEDYVCSPRCDCLEGYVRVQGACVPAIECCNDPNAVIVTCPALCQDTCYSTPDPKCLVTPCNLKTCKCKTGFVLNVYGKCIALNECPTSCNGDPNARPEPCGDPCPVTCENKDVPGSGVCKDKCIINGCKCKPGYVQNSLGICILERDCPAPCGDNEVFDSCPPSCPPEKTCKSYFADEKINCPKSKMATVCKPQCRCKSNYIRNDAGVCVLPKDCCADKNAEVVSCPNPCPGGTCSKPDFTPCKKMCPPKGCQCKKGYVKTSDTDPTCIALNTCPNVCPQYEVYSECGNNGCQNTCINPTFSYACKAPCIPGCVCIEGYLRNSKGICVPPEKCDNCKENQIFSKCDNIPCQNTCSSPDLITRCSYIPGCYPGCVCIEGYLKDDNGNCVPKDRCEKCAADENTVFDPCGDVCPITCENKDTMYLRACPAICKLEGGCRCKDGYVRNIYNKCILKEKCPKCGDHEVFGCGSACDTTCATLGETCPIINIKCVEKCYCIEGYARNDKNICIPVNQCKPKCCQKNQELVPCPSHCPELTCSDYLLTTSYNCRNPSCKPCVPRCQCKKGFIRKVTNGDCIKPEQCCEDCNAELVTCPNPCPGGTCERPEFSPCRMRCPERGCQCKKGYVKDANGKCILLSQCPCNKKCKNPNEVYMKCKRCVGTCEEPNVACAAVCIPGCSCKEGYLMASFSDPTCVKIEDCHLKCKCRDPNAVYSKCKPYVGTCEDPNKPSRVRYVCSPGCACKDGYVRTSSTNSTCVKIDKCPRRPRNASTKKH